MAAMLARSHSSPVRKSSGELPYMGMSVETVRRGRATQPTAQPSRWLRIAVVTVAVHFSVQDTIGLAPADRSGARFCRHHQQRVRTISIDSITMKPAHNARSIHYRSQLLRRWAAIIATCTAAVGLIAATVYVVLGDLSRVAVAVGASAIHIVCTAVVASGAAMCFFS